MWSTDFRNPYTAEVHNKVSSGRALQDCGMCAEHAWQSHQHRTIPVMLSLRLRHTAFCRHASANGKQKHERPLRSMTLLRGDGHPELFCLPPRLQEVLQWPPGDLRHNQAHTPLLRRNGLDIRRDQHWDAVYQVRSFCGGCGERRDSNEETRWRTLSEQIPARCTNPSSSCSFEKASMLIHDEMVDRFLLIVRFSTIRGRSERRVEGGDASGTSPHRSESGHSPAPSAGSQSVRCGKVEAPNPGRLRNGVRRGAVHQKATARRRQKTVLVHNVAPFRDAATPPSVRRPTRPLPRLGAPPGASSRDPRPASLGTPMSSGVRRRVPCANSPSVDLRAVHGAMLNHFRIRRIRCPSASWGEAG